MPRAIQSFQVAIKALIVRDGRLLVLRESNGPGWWELPGGRIDVGEEDAAHIDVLRRELREELGPDFRCRIGAPLVSWTRPRDRVRGEFTFLVGLACEYEGGAIELSDEHSEARWIDGGQWDELEFAPGYQPARAAFRELLEPRGRRGGG
jgi:8-oxo-dGTP pyrophosphatase MutT (NUDIX family)